MRGRDWRELMNLNGEWHEDSNERFFWFRPVIDRNITSMARLIPDHPEFLMPAIGTTGSSGMAIMAGAMQWEGSLDYYYLYERLKNQDPESQIRYLIHPHLREYANDEILAATIKYQYIDLPKARRPTQYDVLYREPYDPMRQIIRVSGLLPCKGRV